MIAILMMALVTGEMRLEILSLSGGELLVRHHQIILGQTKITRLEKVRYLVASFIVFLLFAFTRARCRVYMGQKKCDSCSLIILIMSKIYNIAQ